MSGDGTAKSEPGGADYDELNLIHWQTSRNHGFVAR